MVREWDEGFGGVIGFGVDGLAEGAGECLGCGAFIGGGEGEDLWMVWELVMGCCGNG